MVMVNVHTQGGRNIKANVSGSGEIHWLCIKHSGSEITIFGDAAKVDAFKMIADIINDAFQTSEDDPERETFTEAERAAFDVTDIPF